MMLKTLLHSLLVGLLFPEDIVADFKPEIWSPSAKNTRCVIGDELCNAEIPNLQWTLIDALNVKRSHVTKGMLTPAPMAANMMMLEDDQILRDKAQRYVEGCIRKYGFPKDCPRPGETDNEGDVSVFISKHNKTSPEAPLRIHNVVHKWGYPPANAPEFVKSFNRMQDDGMFVDFAKLVHSHVERVGCGIADYFSTEEEFHEIIACFYDAHKLKDGEELYEVGESSCQHCPGGSVCDRERYIGLCKPEEVQNGILIWQCDLKDYSGECMLERACARHWKVDKTAGFKHINVSGTCVTANVFAQEIFVKEKGCFVFEYQKEGSQIDTTVFGFVSRVNGPDMYGTSLSENEDGDEWNTVHVDIPWTLETVQVGIIVRSTSTSEEQQTIKIRNFSVFAGCCGKI